jgi:hypothetical protein
LSVAFTPVTAAELPDHLVAVICARTTTHPLRVALDGPPAARPQELAEALIDPLRVRGRPPGLVAAETFWRDASLRLEYGREDVEAYSTWLDVDALRREVLDPLGPDGSGHYLPSLRDPVSNRATRAPAVLAGPGAVVIVWGALLLGAGLPFDLSIHLSTSPAARARRTAAEQAWTLPAFDRYDADVRPADWADVVVRVDDPRHPALGRPGPAPGHE